MDSTKNDKRAATMALIMGTLAMLVSFMAWSSIAPLAKIFAADLHINLGYQKLLVAVPVLLGSVMRLPMGILSDKFGGKKVYLCLMGFTLIPLLATPLVINIAKASADPSGYYWGMVFIALLLGMSGTSFAVSISYVSVWFPAEKQGRVLGITGMGNIGNAVAALLLPTIAGAKTVGATTSGDIAKVYYFLVGLTIVFMIIFALTTKEMPTNKNKSLLSALSVAKDPNTWYLSFFYMLTFGSFVAFGNLLPTILSNPATFQITLVTAGLISALFSAIATLVRPLGGTFADKVRPAKLLIVAFVGILISSVILVFGTMGKGIITIFIVGIIVESIFAGLGNGIVFKMVPAVAKENTGAVTGFVGAFGGLGGFFPPLIVAAFGQNLAITFAFLGIFTLMCLALLWFVFFHMDQHIVKQPELMK